MLSRTELDTMLESAQIEPVVNENEGENVDVLTGSINVNLTGLTHVKTSQLLAGNLEEESSQETVAFAQPRHPPKTLIASSPIKESQTAPQDIEVVISQQPPLQHRPVAPTSKLAKSYVPESEASTPSTPLPKVLEDSKADGIHTPDGSPSPTPSAASSQTSTLGLSQRMTEEEKQQSHRIVNTLNYLTGYSREFIIYALYCHSGDIKKTYNYLINPEAKPEWNASEDFEILSNYNGASLKGIEEKKSKEAVEDRFKYVSTICATIPNA